jgi:hydrogenase nickel incorporation protein HypA/HybF
MQMHELAITQSVVDMVVERTAGRRVSSVQLQVGRLSGVVSDAMRFCFDVATADTPLDGATLEIDEITGRASCRRCGDEFDVDDLILLCPCGSADVRIVAGRELLVTSVKLTEASCA